MAFNKFCATIKDNCSVLKITDTTGVYHSITNPLGWGAPSTILASNLTAATITYTVGDSTVRADSTEVNVLANIQSPVVGEFIIAEIDLDDYVDGNIQITYTLTTATDTYVTKKVYFFTCNARCCINKMWAKIAEECDCGCETEKMIEDAMMAEGFLKAVNSAASCVSTEGRQKLLDKITRLCEFNNCNCND